MCGAEEFDKYCFFANNVDLNEDQVAHLKSQVEILKPLIPLYVCRTRKSTVIHGKAKMVNYKLSYCFCTIILVFN